MKNWNNIKKVEVTIPEEFKIINYNLRSGNLRKLLSSSVGNDELRPKFNGIFFEGRYGYATATDQYTLLHYVSKEKNNDLKGIHKLTKKGSETIDAKFPNYKGLVNEQKDMQLCKGIDVEQLYSYAINIKLNQDKNYGVLLGCKETVFYVNPKYLERVCKYFLRLGIYKVNLFYKDNDNPMIFTTTGSYKALSRNNYAILMPISFDFNIDPIEFMPSYLVKSVYMLDKNEVTV